MIRKKHKKKIIYTNIKKETQVDHSLATGNEKISLKDYIP